MAAEPRNRWGIPLTIIVLGLIGWLTLRSAPQDAEAAAQSRFLCIWPCNVEGLRDAVLNVVLFLPLGFALRLWRSTRVAVAVCLAVTLSIELAQQLFLYGRDASLRDLLTNLAGGMLGALLATRWRQLAFPAPAPAARLAALGLGGWLLLLAATAFGLRPSLPPPPYWGQHTPVLGQFDTYRGVLLEARINGHPFPGGRATDSEAFGALLASESLRVEVRVVSGPPTAEVAPIVSVFDDQGHQVLVLGQAGGDLVFVRRTGLEAAELASQNVTLRDFAGRSPGDTVDIQAGLEQGEMIIRTRSAAGGTSERRARLSAGWLWTGLNPFYRQIPEGAWLITAMWLGALLLPGGYWLGRSGGGPARLAWIGVVVAAGLAGVTTLAGLRMGVASEWVGSAAGGVAGWVLGRAFPGGRGGGSAAGGSRETVGGHGSVAAGREAGSGGGRPRGSPLH